MHKHTANLISITRIPASLALLAVFEPRSHSRLTIAFVIAIFVAASDILDGKVARKYKIASKLGYILDGLGDRAFHVSIYLIFVVNGLIGLFVAWILIFREISQYAVRLTEFDWHASQSRVDRTIARSYTIVVQGLFAVTLSLDLLGVSPRENNYILGLNLLLLGVAIASYSRIVPRLREAWLRATYG